MTCKELMTPDPRCCVPEDTVSQAAQIMRDEDVGPVPVVSDRGRKQILGIVTDRDIALNVVAAGLDPRSTQVERIMTRNLVTCRTTDDDNEALDLMARHQVRRIPVVDQQGSLAGIISQADIARRASEEETGEVVEEISRPAGLGSVISGVRSHFGGRRSRQGGNPWLMGAAFLTAGAGMMYLLDPTRGRTRRARLAGQAAGAYHDARDYADKIQRDLRNRASGMVEQAKTKLSRSHDEEVSDQKLEARIRSSLGHETSRSSDIQVRCEGGHVTLEGGVSPRERNRVLSRARNVPGVRDVDDRLQVRQYEESVEETPGWTPAARLLGTALAGCVVAYGFGRRQDQS